ncbi:MAG: hypothetical protein ACREEO_09945 [Phenylobacterium sp.]
MSRLKFVLQLLAAAVLLTAAAWATGVVKVQVTDDTTPTVHRASQ